MKVIEKKHLLEVRLLDPNIERQARTERDVSASLLEMNKTLAAQTEGGNAKGNCYFCFL